MEPLRKWQYAVGGTMLTLVLGFGGAVIATVLGNIWLFVLSEIMIIGGGADFFIVLKILLSWHPSKDVLYYDHPYECGVVAFEKRKWK